MNKSSVILQTLARQYERRKAGKNAESSNDVFFLLEDLLRDAGCTEGDPRALAEQHLQDAEAAGLLERVPAHKRDRSHILRIRFSRQSEAALFACVGRRSPTDSRAAISEQFSAAASLEIIDAWKEAWQAWCEKKRLSALAGESVLPFDRDRPESNTELLALLPKLLCWKSSGQGESMVRFASCVLCNDSKKLESMTTKERDGEFSGQLRGKLGALLSEITHGKICSLDDLGILPNPRFVLAHGPLRLRLEDAWVDLGILRGPFRIAQADIDGALEIGTSAKRCVTVENETSFHELAKLRSGDLLVQTSYPGSGTLALLKRLPVLEFWHFGDSDEAGFDIMRVLSEKSGRDFQALHMQRGRIPFEQESLGRPTLKDWPFYE